jgi:hypothetical protein
MSSKCRRFEVLLPLHFNDGRKVPSKWLDEADMEIVAKFGAASHETQRVQGYWRRGGKLYLDSLVRLVVDVPDTSSNRAWMRGFRDRWRQRMEQIELRLVSYRVEVDNVNRAEPDTRRTR